MLKTMYSSLSTKHEKKVGFISRHVYIPVFLLLHVRLMSSEIFVEPETTCVLTGKRSGRSLQM